MSMNELQQDERYTVKSGKYLLLTRFTGCILEELILCIVCISKIFGDKQESHNKVITRQSNQYQSPSCQEGVRWF